MKTQKSPFRPPLSASSPQEWVVGGRNGGRCFVSMRSHPHERRGAHSASCPVALLNPPHTSPFESRHHQHEQTCPLPPTHKSMTNRRERGGVSTWVAATTRRPQHLCYHRLHIAGFRIPGWPCSTVRVLQLYCTFLVRRKREIETAKHIRMPAPVGGCEGLRVGDKRGVARIELHCGHRKRAENRSRRTLVT